LRSFDRKKGRRFSSANDLAKSVGTALASYGREIMKRLGVIIFLLLLAAAFVGGYWLGYERVRLQEQKFREAQQNLSAATARLASAESRIRICKLQNDLLALVYKTADKNYGDALPLSTKFFDQVLVEAGRVENQKWKTSLGTILQKRDAVTAALAKGDASARDLLAPLEKTLHDLVEAGGQ
jgi:hypothetical protein